MKLKYKTKFFIGVGLIILGICVGPLIMDIFLIAGGIALMFYNRPRLWEPKAKQ